MLFTIDQLKEMQNYVIESMFIFLDTDKDMQKSENKELLKCMAVVSAQSMTFAVDYLQNLVDEQKE